MNRPREVLLLTGPYLESGYPIIAEYADRKNWQLEIAERFNPPRGWTGDGVLSMFLDEPIMNSFLESLVRRTFLASSGARAWGRSSTTTTHSGTSPPNIS